MKRRAVELAARQRYSPRVAAASRAAAFALLWVVLMPSANLGDIAVGLFASICACATSLWLQPPRQGHLRFFVLISLLPHFLYQSLLAGWDVARRAFDPRMPMQPGMVDCPLDLSPGLPRNTFATITSLLPGSVPCGDKDGALVYHCLDVSQPAVQQLKEEERLFARALVAGDDPASQTTGGSP